MAKLNLEAVLKIIDQASNPLQKIQQYAQQTNNNIEQLTESIQRLNHSLNRSSYQRMNQSLRENHQQLNLVKQATQQLDHGYDKISHSLTVLTNKTRQWSQALKQQRAEMRQDFKNSLMTGSMVGFAGYRFLKPAIDFEQQMSRVQAVLDLKKTSLEMQRLEADARKQGAASSFSPKEAAEAQHALASGGFNSKQILDALAGTLQLAEAGQVELQRAAQIAVGTLNGFGLEAKEITRVNDVLLKATDLTATSVDGFGETMKYVAPIAKAYGSSIEKTSALIGVLGNNNILDSQAGTSLRSIMTRFAAQPKPVIKALKRLKIDVADAKGNMRDIADIVEEVNIKTRKMGEQDRLEIYKDLAGQEAISAFAVMVDQSQVIDETTGKTVNKIKQITKELEKSQGAAARAASILKDNLAGDIEQLGGSVQDLAISLTKVLGNDMRNFVKNLTDTIDKIKLWVDAHPELVRQIAHLMKNILLFNVALFTVKYSFSLILGTIFALIAGITKLGVALWLIQKVADKTGVKLPSRFKIYATVIRYASSALLFLSKKAIPLAVLGLRALAIAALTNPLTAIIALIAVVALAIYRYWQPIKSFFKGFWDGLKMGLAPMVDSVSIAFNQLKIALEPLRPIWDSLVSIWNIFKGVLLEMLSPMQANNEQLQTATNLGHLFGMMLGSLIGIVVQTFMTIGRWLGETTAKIALFVASAGTHFNNFKAFLSSVGASVYNGLVAPINGAISAVNSLIAQLNRIPKVSIPSIPSVPTMSQQTALPTSSAKISATTPLKANANRSNVNHFAGANINISGVSDPNMVASIVDRQLQQHQLKLAAQQRRSYGDYA